MKKIIIAALITSALSTSQFVEAVPQAKQETPKETAIGLSAGAVVGGLIGGPVGAFVGAFAGGLIGEKEAGERVIEAQNQALVVMQQHTADYQQVIANNAVLTEQLESLNDEKEQLLQAQLNTLLAMTVQFKTGSSEIAPHFASQLDKVARLLIEQPHLAIDLNGFADQRGDELANLMLSKKRVNAVQSYLIKQGVPHTRLSATAFGEKQSVASSNDYEDNVFDRRVTLTTRPVQNTQLQTAKSNR
ncbi:sortase-associated OmpA-like protein PdsO [Pseudoalteromonas sp. A41-2]|uniref:sortase-associated OmpA-like protein PdsO n=1 Tax=Pseudoalteromonas sp. A41-2 TaxID=2785910 RepID=UPI0018C99CCF|nr:sortase-associated OmpA-like protein PdsO [Pseudoalteromonas sp. A41-2]QPL43573.1 sortase-associated OmpA-like protein PdsO [Pseudoalteromonas sp. A41-2]